MDATQADEATRKERAIKAGAAYLGNALSDDGNMELVARVFADKPHAKLAELVCDPGNWPVDVEISYKAPNEGDNIGKWPTATQRFRPHVKRLLTELAAASLAIDALEAGIIFWQGEDSSFWAGRWCAAAMEIHSDDGKPYARMLLPHESRGCVPVAELDVFLRKDWGTPKETPVRMVPLDVLAWVVLDAYPELKGQGQTQRGHS